MDSSERESGHLLESKGVRDILKLKKQTNTGNASKEFLRLAGDQSPQHRNLLLLSIVHQGGYAPLVLSPRAVAVNDSEVWYPGSLRDFALRCDGAILADNSPSSNLTPNSNHSPLAQDRAASLDHSSHLDSHIILQSHGLIVLPQRYPPLGTHVADPSTFVDDASTTDGDGAAHRVEARARVDYRLGTDMYEVRACQDSAIGNCNARGEGDGWFRTGLRYWWEDRVSFGGGVGRRHCGRGGCAKWFTAGCDRGEADASFGL